MKKLSEHLGAIVAVLAAVALLVSVVAFTSPGLTNFFSEITDKTIEKADNMLDGILTPSANGGDGGSSETLNEYGFYYDKKYNGSFFSTNDTFVFSSDGTVAYYVNDSLTSNMPVAYSNGEGVVSDGGNEIFLFVFSDDGSNMYLIPLGQTGDFSLTSPTSAINEYGFYYNELYGTENNGFVFLENGQIGEWLSGSYNIADDTVTYGYQTITSADGNKMYIIEEGTRMVYDIQTYTVES